MENFRNKLITVVFIFLSLVFAVIGNVKAVINFDGVNCNSEGDFAKQLYSGKKSAIYKMAISDLKGKDLVKGGDAIFYPSATCMYHVQSSNFGDDGYSTICNVIDLNFKYSNGSVLNKTGRLAVDGKEIALNNDNQRKIVNSVAYAVYRAYNSTNYESQISNKNKSGFDWESIVSNEKKAFRSYFYQTTDKVFWNLIKGKVNSNFANNVSANADAYEQLSSLYKETVNKGIIKLEKDDTTVSVKTKNDNTYLGPFRVSYSGYPDGMKNIEVKIYDKTNKKYIKDDTITKYYVYSSSKKKYVQKDIKTNGLKSDTNFYIKIPSIGFGQYKYTVVLNSNKVDIYRARIMLSYDKTANAQNLAYYYSDTEKVTHNVKWSGNFGAEPNISITIPVFEKKPDPGTLKIVKVDSENSSVRLQGAKFSIQNSEGNYIKVSSSGKYNGTSSYIQKISTNANGEIYITELPIDTYTITEEDPPENYEIIENQTTSEGYRIVGGETTVSVEENKEKTITWKNKKNPPPPEPAKITFQKRISSSGLPLDGATFRVRIKNGDQYGWLKALKDGDGQYSFSGYTSDYNDDNTLFVTNALGQIKIYSIYNKGIFGSSNNYYEVFFDEVQAPSGYKLNIQDDYQRVYGNSYSGIRYGYNCIPKKIGVLEFGTKGELSRDLNGFLSNERYGDLKIVKKDQNGNPLKDIAFVIKEQSGADYYTYLTGYDSYGKPKWASDEDPVEFYSDENGEIIFRNLPLYGLDEWEYIIEERTTRHDSVNIEYQENLEYRVKVKANDLSCVEITTPITNIETANLRIVKQDDSGARLPGVEFKLKLESGNYLRIDDSDKITNDSIQIRNYANIDYVDEDEATVFVTGSQGTVYISNIPLGTYIFEETRNSKYGYNDADQTTKTMKVTNGKPIVEKPQIEESSNCYYYNIEQPREGSILAKVDIGNKRINISGGGKMNDWGYWNLVPWGNAYVSTYVRNVEIEEGVTTIGQFAFYACSYLTDIKIPNSVTSISNYAFPNNNNNFTVHTSNEYVINYCKSHGIKYKYCGIVEYSLAYIGAGSLTAQLNIDTGLLRVFGNGTMRDFSNVSERPWDEYINDIKYIDIEDGVTTIGKNAFTYAQNLEWIKVPNTLTSIGTSAFHGCGDVLMYMQFDNNEMADWVRTNGENFSIRYWGLNYINNYTITNSKSLGDLKIEKVDKYLYETYNKKFNLSGVRFRIKRSNGTDEEYLMLKDKNGRALNGATVEGNATIDISNTGGSDNYTAMYYGSKDMATYFQTDSDGKITINNLEVYASGSTKYTYYLEEVDMVGPNSKYYGTASSETVSVQLTRNATTTKIVKNRQQYIDLKGYVWDEELDGSKENKINDVWNSNDKRIGDIQVTLYKNGTKIDECTTDENGEYLFEGIELYALGNEERGSGLSQYKIEFEYNGLKYQSVVKGEMTVDNSSKAVERDRTSLNNDFYKINGQSEKQSNGSTRGQTDTGVVLNYSGLTRWKSNLMEDLTYRPDSSSVASAIYGNSSRSTRQIVQVFADINNENNSNDIKTRMDYQLDKYQRDLNTDNIFIIDNLNLGIYKREQPDMALSMDLATVELQFHNGTQNETYSHTYKYGNRLQLDDSVIYDIAKFDGSNTSFENTKTYERKVYKNDVYANGENGNAFNCYLTYAVAVKNESNSLTMRAEEIAGYFDNDLEIVESWYSDKKSLTDGWDSITNANRISWTQKASSSDYTEYRTIGLSGTDIAPDTSRYVYVRVQKKNVIQWASIAQNNGNNGIDSIYNIAEIASYSTYKEGNRYAGIDKDSAPDNIVSGDCTDSNYINRYFEDDTDSAPILKIVLEEPKTITGYVFEDNTSSELKTGEERKGDGILNDKDSGRIKDVKVELMSIDSNNVQNVATLYPNARESNDFITTEIARKYTTCTGDKEKDGYYEFKGIIPGKYYLKYTYGTYKDGEITKTSTICVDGTEKDNITTEKYKSTIYSDIMKQNEDDLKWYQNSQIQNNSVATDDISIREKVNKRLSTINYDVKTDYENNTDDYQDIQEMTALSPDLEIAIEKYPGEATQSNEGVTRVFNNIDFGIVERPRTGIKVDKEISNVKITLSNGNILMDGDPRKDNLPYVTYPEGGILKIEVDDEIIQGATLELKYAVKVNNISELDYDSDEYYKYGDNSGLTPVKLKVQPVIAYLDDKLAITYDGTVNADNVIKEDGSWTLIGGNSVIYYGNNRKVLSLKNDVRNVIKSTENVIAKDLNVEIEPGKEGYTEAFTAKKLLSNSGNADQNFDTNVEVVQIYNSLGRFYGQMKNGVWQSDTPGNYNVQKGTPIESDNAGEIATITPPTGENALRIYIIISVIVGVLVISAGVIVFIKRKRM